MGLVVLTICFTSGCVLNRSQPSKLEQLSNVAAPIEEGAFEIAINSFRSSSGAGVLRRNVHLDEAAQAHALDMVTRGYFSHQSPGGPNGENFADRARAKGCQLRAGAENIAYGQRTEAAVFEAWKNSTGHRRNMEKSSFTLYGLGRANDTWVLLLSSGC